MTIFDHEDWPRLQPYARLSVGRDNLDLLQLPDDLRDAALAIRLPCVTCGAPIHPFRKRALSERARIAGRPEERRLYYAASCASDVSAGCARSRAAKDHKALVRDRLGVEAREPDAALLEVEIRDASGDVILSARVSRDPLAISIPPGAHALQIRPATSR